MMRVTCISIIIEGKFCVKGKKAEEVERERLQIRSSKRDYCWNCFLKGTEREELEHAGILLAALGL